jgi:hypothetical protein
MNRAADALFVLRAHKRLAHVSAERDRAAGPAPTQSGVTPVLH